MRPAVKVARLLRTSPHMLLHLHLDDVRSQPPQTPATAALQFATACSRSFAAPLHLVGSGSVIWAGPTGGSSSERPQAQAAGCNAGGGDGTAAHRSAQPVASMKQKREREEPCDVCGHYHDVRRAAGVPQVSV